MLKRFNGLVLKRLNPKALLANAHARLVVPRIRRLVPKLIAGTASLELIKGEHRELAPVPGMYGRVFISGNSLPEFKYVTFDQALMEFVTVRVHLGLGHAPEYQAYIPVDNNPATLIESPWLNAYALPFSRLARHLASYFPLLPIDRGATRAV